MNQYKSLAKKVVRVLRCLKEKELLGERYSKVIHPFLSGPIGGDASVYLAMGIEPSKIWAIDREREAYRQCEQRWARFGVQCFYDRHGIDYALGIAQFLGRPELKGGMAPYLDYCGPMSDATYATTHNVISKLGMGDVFSITHLRGREVRDIGDHPREKFLLEQIHHWQPRAFLAQSIYYHSKEDDKQGSPMMTLTFGIGEAKEPAYIDLRKKTDKELLQVVKDALAEEYSYSEWMDCFLDNLEPEKLIMAVKLSKEKQKRRNAALKAWRTIRANKKKSKKQ